jgi:hypothetical protein
MCHVLSIHPNKHSWSASSLPLLAVPSFWRGRQDSHSKRGGTSRKSGYSLRSPAVYRVDWYRMTVTDKLKRVFTAVTMKNGVFWVVTPCGSCRRGCWRRCSWLKLMPIGASDWWQEGYLLNSLVRDVGPSHKAPGVKSRTGNLATRNAVRPGNQCPGRHSDTELHPQLSRCKNLQILY